MARRNAERRRMVTEQIECRGIRQPDLLRVMESIPRHLFVPARFRDMAYDDRPLSIGYRATISQPFIVAFMTELLMLNQAHRVLEIGTGSGYQTAILGRLAGYVCSVEVVPELAAAASRLLRRLGYSNVTVRHGDGYAGWPELAPFDRIIVTAAPPVLPKALTAQLAPGGRLVAPVGSMRRQELMLIVKTPDGALEKRLFGPVSFVPMEREKVWRE